MTISSAIESIYSAIADYAVPIASKGISLTARKQNEFPNRIDTANLPIRLLMSFSAGVGNSTAQAQHLGVSPITQMTWTITDVALFATTSSGIGLAEHLPLLMEYAAAYVDLPLSQRSPVTGKSIILTGFSIAPNVIEYPLFSNVNYYGVTCELTYTENIWP